MKRLVLLFALFISLPAAADPTGAGDAAIVQQLILLVKQTNEQLKQFREMTDISKNLEKMEALKQTKKVTDQGEQFSDLFDELEKTGDTVSDIQDDVAGVSDLKRAIENIQRDMDRAEGKKGLDQAKSYSRIIADLKRISFIKNAQKKAMKKLSTGTNEEENQQITATSTTIMSDLIMQREEREKMRRASDTRAVNDLLEGVRYSSMVPGDDS